MSQNQENIEAKLCAYIDDELDAAGRGELEKHLAANPQHQRLIEELRRTSALVRNLPHESAPAELAEGFNAQLERSVLLEGVSEDVAAADLKSPRWPQLMAMAAITLLTVGLAAVVYFALPGTGGRPQIVQVIPHPATAPSNSFEDERATDSKFRAFDKTTAPESERLLRSREAGGHPLASNAPAPRPPESPVAEELSDRDASVTRYAASKSIALSESHGAAPVVLVMHSDDPGEARRSLVLYLVQQNIAWEPARAPAKSDGIAPDGAVQKQAAVGGAMGLALKTALSQTQPMADQSQLYARRGLAKDTGPTTTPASEIGNVAPDLLAASAAAEGPATQAVAVGAKGTLDAQAKLEGTVAGRRSDSDAKPDFAVTCRVTPEQAEALRASLAQAGISIDPLPAFSENEALVEVKRKAGLTDLPDAPKETASAPAPSPTAPAIAPGSAAVALPATAPSSDAASLSVPEPAGSAVDQLKKLGVVTTEPTVDQAVNLPAAPATQPDPNAITMLDLVIVVRPAERPSTQPIEPAATVAPTTQPAVQAAPDASPAPATQP